MSGKKGIYYGPHKGSQPAELIDLIINDDWRPTYEEMAIHFYNEFNLRTYKRINSLVMGARYHLRKQGIELYCNKKTRRLEPIEKADDLLRQMEINVSRTVRGTKNVFRQQEVMKKDHAGSPEFQNKASAVIFGLLESLGEVGSIGLLQLNGEKNAKDTTDSN